MSEWLQGGRGSVVRALAAKARGWLLKQWKLWLLLLPMSLSVMLQPGFSLFISLGSQFLTLSGAHPLQPGLFLFFSLGSQSVTSIDAHPLQPGLSLPFSFICLSFPSLL